MFSFQRTMKETDGEEITGKFTIDTEYIIQLAMQKQIPWNSLTFMLTDLSTNLEISKQVIRILVQELEKLALKEETDTHETNRKTVKDPTDGEINKHNTRSKQADRNKQVGRENF